jgi:hypothetical protein
VNLFVPEVDVVPFDVCSFAVAQAHAQKEFQHVPLVHICKLKQLGTIFFSKCLPDIGINYLLNDPAPCLKANDADGRAKRRQAKITRSRRLTARHGRLLQPSRKANTRESELRLAAAPEPELLEDENGMAHGNS